MTAKSETDVAFPMTHSAGIENPYISYETVPHPSTPPPDYQEKAVVVPPVDEEHASNDL